MRTINNRVHLFVYCMHQPNNDERMATYTGFTERFHVKKAINKATVKGYIYSNYLAGRLRKFFF